MLRRLSPALLAALLAGCTATATGVVAPAGSTAPGGSASPAASTAPAASTTPGASTAPAASATPTATASAGAGAGAGLTVPASAFAVKIDGADVAFTIPGEVVPKTQVGPTSVAYRVSNWTNGKGYKIALNFTGKAANGAPPTALDQVEMVLVNVVKDLTVFSTTAKAGAGLEGLKAFAVADGKLRADLSLTFAKGSTAGSGPLALDLTLTDVPAVGR